MVVALVRLRIAVQRGTVGAAQYIAAWVIGGVAGGLGALTTAGLASLRGIGDVSLLLFFTLAFATWVFAPLVVPGLSARMLDATRLAPYPLSVRQRLSGLLLGGLLSPTALATLALAIGPAAAFGLDAAARIAVAIGAVAYTVLCVTVSYALQAAFGGALDQGRGRGVVVVLTALLVLGAFLLSQAARDVLANLADARGPIGSALGWTPPGAAAQFVLSVRDGSWWNAVLRLALVLAAAGVAVPIWAWGLRRHERGTTHGRIRRRRSEGSGRIVLVPRPLRRVVPLGPAGAAFAQQLRYHFLRAPRAAEAMAIIPVAGAVLIHGATDAVGLPLATAWLAALATIAASANVFGHDGRGFDQLVLSGAPLARVLAGKLAFGMAFGALLVTLGAPIEGLVRGVPGEIPGALLGGYAAVVACGAVAAGASVLNAYDQEHPPRNRYRVLLVGLAATAVSFGLVTGVAGAWQRLSVPALPAAAVSVLLAVPIAVLFVRAVGERLQRRSLQVLAGYHAQ